MNLDEIVWAGNVIDPIDTIEKVGSDALRFSLVTGSTPGQDISLSMDKIESNRNFVNKIWNIGKYMKNIVDTYDAKIEDGIINDAELFMLPLAERYIVSRCHDVSHQVTVALESYEFGEAGKYVYEFVWDEFADWYLEVTILITRSYHFRYVYIVCTFVQVSKIRGRDSTDMRRTVRVLYYVWTNALRLLHPFMPFITEVLPSLSCYPLLPSNL